MHDWLGTGLITLGVGLIGSGIIKRQSRLRTPLPAGAIRPEFAAMGKIARPLILCAIAIFAVKISLFYFLFGGQRFLSPFNFTAILFVLAAYSGWLIMATKRPALSSSRGSVVAGKRSTA